MVLHYDPQNGPVIKAAQQALATGNFNYVMIWVPEELKNTLKNILEKTFCERSVRKNMQNRTIIWYFEAVNRLHSASKGALPSFSKPKGRDESPIVPMIERAIGTGNLKKYPALSQIPYQQICGDVFTMSWARVTMIEIIVLLVVNRSQFSLTS